MSSIDKNSLNWLTTSIVLLYPLMIVVLVAIYIANYSFGGFEIALTVITYYVCNISVGLGFHRLWSHASYKTNKYVEFVLMLLTSGTLQGPAIAWASDHKFHHAYADSDLDPHTPLRYKNRLKGLLWSHIGWMMFGESTYKRIDRVTMKRLGRNKILMWQLKNYLFIAVFMNALVPVLIGYLLSGTVQGAIAGYLFMGLGRAIQQQMTFCVNSLCHFIGSRKYVNDSSCDVWWLFFLLLGENWHNFHHAFGNDYRNGHRWYHLDIHKWLIALLAKLGLAWDLVVTPQERIIAKMEDMRSKVESSWKVKLVSIESASYRIAELARNKMCTAEKSALVIAENLKSKLIFIESAALNLASKAKSLGNASDALTERLINKLNKKLKSLEKIAFQIVDVETANQN